MLKKWLLPLFVIFSHGSIHGAEDCRPIDVQRREVVPIASPCVEWSEGEQGRFGSDELHGLYWRLVKLPFDAKQGRKPVWYRYSIRNDSDVARELVVSSLDGHLADFVVLHVKREGGGVETYFSGTKLPRDFRSSATRLISFPIKFRAHESVEMIMGISSIFGRNLLFDIQDSKRHEWVSQIINFFFGIHFGLMGFCLLMNVAVWWTLRLRSHLAYAVACGLSLATAMIGTGFAGQMVPGQFNFPWAELGLIFIALTVTSMVWFNREFLELKGWAPNMYRVSNLLIVIGLSLAVFASDSSRAELSVTLASVYVLISSVFGFVTSGVSVVRNKSPFGWYYLVGSAVYLLGGYLWNLAYAGTTVPSNLKLHSYFAAQMFENAVFTLAIMVHVRQLFRNSVATQEAKRHSEKMGIYNHVLTHDLSNYMTIIKLASDKLIRSDLGGEAVKAIGEKISSTVMRQKSVVFSVQKLMAVESGKLVGSLASVNLQEEIANLDGYFKEDLRLKNIVLKIDLRNGPDHEGAYHVVADQQTLFHSVLANILHNSIKFSRPGGVIEISLESRKNFVHLFIKDYGVGIPPAILKNLFSPSHATTRSGTNGEKGTGLGLPICKALMDIYGGRISVSSVTEEESPVMHGTEFELMFKRVDC